MDDLYTNVKWKNHNENGWNDDTVFLWDLSTRVQSRD